MPTPTEQNSDTGLGDGRLTQPCYLYRFLKPDEMTMAGDLNGCTAGPISSLNVGRKVWELGVPVLRRDNANNSTARPDEQ